MRIPDGRLKDFWKLFVHRRDVYAVQRRFGGYYVARRPVTDQLLHRHLEGKTTIGLYALAPDNTARWAVIDSDAEEGLSDLQGLWRELQRLGMPAYLERSRRGGHLWFFFEPMAAAAIYYSVHWLLRLVGFDKRVEVFPKQRKLKPGGVGSLVRAPLGVHRVSGKRYGFVDPATLEYVGRTLAAQLEYLASVERVPSHRVAELLAEALAHRSVKKHKASGEIARLKDRVGDIHLFVSQYMDLDPNGRGHCPFHDDVHKSFSVNREEGYWNCFAGCGGGDAIHFYERIKGITRGQAIRELLRAYPEEKPG